MRIQLKPRAAAGATLVELLLAIFVISVAGAGIMGTFLSAHALTVHARETSAALDDLQVMMERIQATPYALLASNFPDSIADGGMSNDYGAIVGGYTLADEQITVTYPNSNALLREITATVTWTQRGRASSLSLSTIRSSS